MRAKARGLADVLFGKARGALLALLYSRPSDSFYYREITRRLPNVSPGTIQRELEVLSGLGLVQRTVVGNQVFYQVNRDHPVFSELRALVAKTVGSVEVLRSALQPLAGRIEVAFVYGSVARSEEKAESDIDLLVVGETRLEEVLERIGPVEASLRVPVNPTVYSAKELRAKLARKNHFLTSVVRGSKVFLIGSTDDLERLGGIRLAESRGD